MKFYLLLILTLISSLCFSQTNLDSLVNKIKNSELSATTAVKDKIINTQKDAIPKLIQLLKDTSFAKLKNTADLIYPGAEKFYGHGWVVNYDIDWIAVRAAWILEEITFEDFGYLDLTITEKKLRQLHEEKYTSEYLNKGYHEIDFKDKKPREQLKIYRLMLADKVSKWWEVNKQTWTRFSALKNALLSKDMQRQGLALHYLRFGETTCSGLTLETYLTELKPLVELIKESKTDQSEQAKYLLDDKEYYWLKQKSKKSGS